MGNEGWEKKEEWGKTVKGGGMKREGVREEVKIQKCRKREKLTIILGNEYLRIFLIIVLCLLSIKNISVSIQVQFAFLI